MKIRINTKAYNRDVRWAPKNTETMPAIIYKNGKMHHKFERKSKLKNSNLKLQSYRYYAMKNWNWKFKEYYGSLQKVVLTSEFFWLPEYI